MSNEESARTSDYDVLDIQAEDIDEELELLKPEYESLELVLNRFPLSDTIIGNFYNFQIQYSQLKDLTRDDLLKLGIKDNKLQDEMLEEFANLKGAAASTSRTAKRSLPPLKFDPNSSICESLHQHLFRLNTLLTAITFQTGLKSASSTGIVINKRLCSAKVVMHLLQKLNDHTAEMEEIVKTLGEADKFDEAEVEFIKLKRKERKRNCIVLLSTIGAFIAGFFIAKRLGVRKVL